MPNWDSHKDTVLRVAWADYRTWAKTSRSTAQQLQRWRFYILALAISGALLSTSAQFVHTPATAGSSLAIIHRCLASVGALAIAFGAYLTRELLSEETQRKWLRSRAAAEGAKSEACLFRLGCSPYDGDDAVQKLLDALNSQKKLTNGLTHDVMSESELVERLPVGPLQIEEYVKDRVDEQIKWYNDKVDDYVSYMASTRKITLALGCASVVLSAIALKDIGAELIPLIATLTVSLGSAVAAAQIGYLITSYQSTSDQLSELKQEWSLSPDPSGIEAVSAMARACERVMSSENSAWMAKLSEKIQQPERGNAIASVNVVKSNS